MGCVNAVQGINIQPHQISPQIKKQSLKNSQKNHLTVATLNYCGVLDSPFEFYYDGFTQELQEIGGIYMNTLPQYFPNFKRQSFRWNLGKIDLKFGAGRYSPMFDLHAGINKDRFMTRKQFQNKWQEVFQANRKKIDTGFKEQQKKATKLYDLIIYHTFLRYVYGIDKLEEAKDKDTHDYIILIRPFFQLPFLAQNRKQKNVLENIQKVQADIFFFQEYSPQFYKKLVDLNKYSIAVDSTKNTLIAASKKVFKKVTQNSVLMDQLNQQQKAEINWSQKTSMIILDSYIVIGVHLSSKADKNKQQIQKFQKSLLLIKNKFPEYHIIAGGDLNSFLKPFNQSFQMYPSDQSQLTTIKRRTMTQAQFQKGNKTVAQSKDKVISTLKLNKGAILYIDGTVPKAKSLLPSQKHPFDHFVVAARFQIHT